MTTLEIDSAGLGLLAMERLEHLAGFTEEPGVLTRTYLSAPHRAAADCVAGWMREAGMAVHLDAVGSVVGRYEAATPGAKALVLGSHIDTVRNAGKYDGNFGVVAAIGAVEALHRQGRRLPFAIEVFAFGDEEGVRFPGTLRGSLALAGTLPPEALEVKDRNGVSVREALIAFGADPDALPAAARQAEDLIGYAELHIEQGPVLEAENLAVGVVTAIAAAKRFAFRLEGMAGHAGTVPMGLRADSLAAAAEIMLAVERRCQGHDGLVGTVGVIEALPGATNVIPGKTNFTLDLRAGTAEVRDAAAADILAEAAAIAARRGITLSHELQHRHDGCQSAAWMMEAWGQALADLGLPVRHLPSGAGHDAMAVATLTDVSMLFVRCKGGISHNPRESITAEDAGTAIAATLAFLDRVAQR